ncbi:hypothetical protein R3W88_004152 [Solanum pinnatisectum]|uniref:Leucine-rich repeat-containing N-terminal plant-type domain-containing protein n=1 Tax=Solanum pinnatisectum TaxID=50273 RepID=A0AAV9KAJ1_9SOLN|nr:hypothetical protein R3W88_004152 [Solanum pinnatisectum]
MSSKILFLFTISVSIFTLFLPTNSDIVSDRATLLSIRSALRGRSLLWNITSPTCSWPGVICSPDKSSVLELHLPGMGLLGQIPPGLFSNLTKLNFLSLRYNALSGVIPANHFMICGNGFSGQIPDLNLPSMVQFNVLNNQLNGSIPSNLAGQPKDAFLGTSLCGKPLDSCDGSSSSIGEGKKKKLSGGAIAGIVIGCVVGLLLLLCLLFFCCRKRGKKETRSADVGAVSKQVEVEMPEERGVESNGGKDGFLGSAIAAIGVGGGFLFLCG